MSYSVVNEVKQIIRNRVIAFIGISVLRFGFFLRKPDVDFYELLYLSIKAAFLAVMMFSLCVGAAMSFKINFMWSTYRRPNHWETFHDNFHNRPFIGWTSEVLNERGMHARNRMFANFAVFLLGLSLIMICGSLFPN